RSRPLNRTALRLAQAKEGPVPPRACVAPRLRYAGTFARSEAVLFGEREGRLSGRPEARRAVGSFRAEGFQACSPEADRTNAPPAPAEEIRRAERLRAPGDDRRGDRDRA